MEDYFNQVVDTFMYHKVGSSRPDYYSILEMFDERSQFVSIKFLFINILEVLWCATNQDSLLFAILRYVLCYRKCFKSEGNVNSRTEIVLRDLNHLL